MIGDSAEMSTNKNRGSRTRIAGLLASTIAVAALAVTVLADNHNAGSGHTVTRGEQMLLLGAAVVLLIGQVAVHLVQASRRVQSGEPERQLSRPETKPDLR
jgi:hypothetical protein